MVTSAFFFLFVGLVLTSLTLKKEPQLFGQVTLATRDGVVLFFDNLRSKQSIDGLVEAPNGHNEIFLINVKMNHVLFSLY